VSALIASLLFVAVAAPADDPPATVSVVAWDGAGNAAVVTVDIDDRSVQTPATISLAAGQHVVSFVQDGTRQSIGTFVVRPGEFVDLLLDVDTTGSRAPRTTTLRDVDDPAGRAEEATTTTQEPTASAAPAAAARVTLRARSLVDDLPLAGARVHRRGAGEVGIVDAEGALEFSLPPGPSSLSVVLAGFAPRVVDLDVGAGEEREVIVALLPLADDLDELTVRAPHLRGGVAQAVSERREQKQVVEVLGSEQMKKSGDSDAAAALRRVTGLTVVGGRFVYVRGLGDRYSSTLVNGAPLPSPEPERRVVPLDLFPSTMLDALVVQKTWSPDLPGEFGGGSVQLRTRGGPTDADKPLLSFGLSTGLLLGTSLTSQAQAPGGPFDLLGFDDGRRAIPSAVVTASRNAPIAEGNALTGGGLTKKELEQLGESFSTAWSPQSSLVLPALGASAAWGDTFQTPWGRLGALAALTWSSDTTRTDTTRQILAGAADAVVVADDLRIASTERSAAWSTIVGFSLRPSEGSELRSTTFLNRAADDEARIVDGYDDDNDARLRLVRLRYVARQLLVQQFTGTHALPWAPWTEPTQLSWRAGYALAQRDEPGQRTVRYDEGDGGRMLVSARSDGNQILSSALVDHVVDGNISLRVPFSQWDGEPGRVSVGVATAGKLRAVDTRRYKFLLSGPRATDLDLRANTMDDVLTPSNIGPDGFTLAEATRNTDNHTGSALVLAGFATGELPILPDVVVSGGLRVEGSRLEVTTFELFNAAAAPVVAELQNIDALPSLALSWGVLDDVTLKAAFARTVVRPELRELSPALYTDVAGSRARFGNPKLLQTSIVHVDVRAEWALSPTDGLSLAVFAKQFDKPIESVVTAGSDQALTPANVDGAFNAGAELEGRVGLATFVPAVAEVPVLGGLWVGGNGALIASRVFIGAEQQGILTSKERALEGQSPWVANAQAGFDDDARGTSLSVLYNVFGPRIVEVGALGLPDAVEEPFHQLDVVYRQRLAGGFTLGLKAANLIDAPATRTQAGRTVDSVVRGRAVSASLSWTW
jgi:hypothetical protein